MGTRHLICAILDNEIKIAQFGQWDGYFLGQGQDIINFILNQMDKKIFKDALKTCSFLSEEEMHTRGESEDVPEEFTRNCGSNILNLVQNKGVRKLINCYDFGAESLFCEYAYIINMDKEELEVYTGFNKKQLTKEERFYPISKENNGYYAIKLFKTIPFSSLTMDTMQNLKLLHNRIH